MVSTDIKLLRKTLEVSTLLFKHCFVVTKASSKEMESSKVYLVCVVSFLFVSFVMGGRFINNEIKSFVSIGPNSTKFLDPISTSVVSIVDPTKYLYPTSLVSTVFNDISFQGDIKRLVPTGPNSAQSPDPPIKRLVPTGPNLVESPNPTPIKRLVPTGPNPTKFLDPISTSVVSIVDPTKSLDPRSLVSIVSNGVSFQGDIKRLVPTGPNSAQSPDPPIKRLVPTGPNSAESPDPTPFVSGLISRQVDIN